MHLAVLRSNLGQSLKAIKENVEYILGELPKLTVSKTAKDRISSVCTYFISVLNDVASIMIGINENCNKFIDSPGAKSGNIVQSAMGDLEAALRKALFAMHELVKSLELLPEDDKILFILVAESANNILRAEKGIADSISAINMIITQITSENPDFKGSDLKSVSLPCSQCGQSDCMSVGVMIANNYHPFYHFSEKDGPGVLILNHGEKLIYLGPEVLKSYLSALEQGRVNELLEYPYCAKCSLAFCKDHWTEHDVIFDDGFYDCTYATCPKGHRVMIDD